MMSAWFCTATCSADAWTCCSACHDSCHERWHNAVSLFLSAAELRAQHLASHCSFGAHSTCSTASSSHSGRSITGFDDRGAQVAAAAGASPSLMRAITRVRSLKLSDGGARCSASGSGGSRCSSHSGNGGSAAVISELLEEPETAKHISTSHMACGKLVLAASLLQLSSRSCISAEHLMLQVIKSWGGGSVT